MASSIYKNIINDFKNERDLLIPGVTVGVVTELGEEEKDFGKVKVKIINISKEDFVTDFIRIMTPVSGKNTGVFFMPQVGDEVVLSFCDGDISKPYVLGCLWNDKSKQPTEVTKETKDFIMIKSRSGHQITIGDKEGEEKINVTSKEGLTISIQDKEKTITFKDKEDKNSIILDSTNGTITIKADKGILLQSKKAKITLDGEANQVNVEGSDGVTIDGKKSTNIKGQKVVINGSSGLDLKSGSQINVDGGSALNLKGGMVKIN